MLNDKELLQECLLQLEYINSKFPATGTTTALISKIKRNLDDTKEDDELCTDINLETFKPYRFEGNPKEKEFVDNFKKHSSVNEIEMKVFGTTDNKFANDQLTNREMKIVLSTIQWLGSPVGNGFIHHSRYIENKLEKK